jgi:hypothetical protein
MNWEDMRELFKLAKIGKSKQAKAVRELMEAMDDCWSCLEHPTHLQPDTRALCIEIHEELWHR